MTFPAELERLLKSYKAEANAIERFRIGQQIDALIRNHADAILGLVRAAENLRDVKGRYHTEQATLRLFEALAKLNGEGK